MQMRLEAGGIAPLVALLSEEGDAMFGLCILQEAARALGVLARSSAAHREAIAAAGAVAPLRALQKRLYALIAEQASLALASIGKHYP